MKTEEIQVGKTYRGKGPRTRKVVRRYILGGKVFVQYYQYNADGFWVYTDSVPENQFARWAKEEVA